MLKRALIAVALVVCPHVAAGATFVVNSTVDAVDASPGDGVCATTGGVCTLRAAVQEADALVGAHAIALRAGTYLLSIGGRGTSSAATGDLDVVFRNITINGAGRAATIIDANQLDRIFDVLGGGLTLNDLTVQNGNPLDVGGCIAGSSTVLTLARVNVTGCNSSVSVGGGIIVSGSTMNLTDSAITRNTTSSQGGGISVLTSTATITRTIVSGNFAQDVGGGLAAYKSILTLSDSTIAQNLSAGPGGGGGISILSGTTATVSRTTISGNSAQSGAGLAVFGDSGNGPSVATVTESTIAQNLSAANGGAVFLTANGDGNAAITMANTTIAGNTAASASGGAIFAAAGSGLTLTNVTIAANSSATGGAVTNLGSLVEMKNAIVANNGGAAPFNCSPAAYRDLGNNLEFPGTACGFNLSSDRRANPLLGPLANNGGTTETMALLPDSAAIDGGDDATCALAPVAALDQRGSARPSGSHCDIGAYEAAVPTFTTQPPGQTIYVGRPAQFGVAVNGSLAYQWQVSTNAGASWTNLTNSSLYGGVTTPTLTLSSVSIGLNGAQYRVVVTNGAGSAISNVATLGVVSLTSSSDFDLDRKAELTVYRPSSGQWFMRLSHHGYDPEEILEFQWGLPGDLPKPGDFDGDGQTDLVVYRPTSAEWFIRYSSTGYAIANAYGAFQWGLPGDEPLIADFDGDGKTDLTVYRPSTGEWYIRYSSAGYAITGYGLAQWGVPGDRPLAADFDGDGRTDLTVFRPSTGEWFIRYSSAAYDVATFAGYQWGLPGDTPIATDFDGDGKTDLAVFRPATGEWFIRYSSAGYTIAGGYGLYQWGLVGDVPIATDFDGDGKSELAVYRPITGEWYIRYSSQNYSLGTFGTFQWGVAGDRPVPIP